MKFHELANIFPMLGEEELKDLCADIEKNGLAEPITVYEGKILDGRNRATACQRLGIEPKTVEYTGDDPVAFVLSKNLHRRHLTTSQRAMIADELANMSEGRPELTAQNCAVNQSEAAKRLSVSRRTVQEARKVRTKTVPEVAKAVKAGKVPVSVAARFADAPPEEQREAIARVERGEKRTSTNPPPRRKTVAKEPEPEPEQTKLDQYLAQEAKKETEWWDAMAKGYRQLTDGEEMTATMRVPVPFHHNVVLTMFRQAFADKGEEVRNQIISEVKLLADRIEELHY